MRRKVIKKQNPRLVIGLAAIASGGFALYNLYHSIQDRGLSAEFAMFGVLAIVFAAVWWAARHR